MISQRDVVQLEPRLHLGAVVAGAEVVGELGADLGPEGRRRRPGRARHQMPMVRHGSGGGPARPARPRRRPSAQRRRRRGSGEIHMQARPARAAPTITTLSSRALSSMARARASMAMMPIAAAMKTGCMIVPLGRPMSPASVVRGISDSGCRGSPGPAPRRCATAAARRRARRPRPPPARASTAQTCRTVRTRMAT